MERRGMKLEPIFWSSYKNGKGYDDIFRLIDSAIVVLALEKPDEFLKRRNHIVEFLFKNHDEQQLHSPQPQQQQQQQQHSTKSCSRILDDVSIGGVKQQQQRNIDVKRHPKQAAAAAAEDSLRLVQNIDDGKKKRDEENSHKSAALSSCLDQDIDFALRLTATKRKLQETVRIRRGKCRESTAGIFLRCSSRLAFKTSPEESSMLVPIDRLVFPFLIP